MKKLLGVMATMTLATALSAVAFAQQDQSTQPSAQPAPDAQSSQDNQTPQQPTADQQGSQQPSAPDQDSSNSMPTAQTSSFTGTVVKAGGKYVLKTSDMNYQLDDQKKAKQFVGQQVKVSGTLDSTTSTIHVSDITTS